MAQATCSVVDKNGDRCEKPVTARGYCNVHYRRWLKDGDPRPEQPVKQPLTPERFWAQTEEQDVCVVWTGCLDAHGYGAVRWKRKTVKAHRLAFFFRMGRWPDGLMRHLCNNPRCVLHAVEGTHSENMRDIVVAGNNVNASKTHCPKGHAYDETNTARNPNGSRRCRTCSRIRSLAYYHRTRSARRRG